jgi:hypothetical protein
MLTLRTDPAEQDVDVIHRFLSEESTWARGIPKQLVCESMQNSLNFGLFESGVQRGSSPTAQPSHTSSTSSFSSRIGARATAVA